MVIVKDQPMCSSQLCSKTLASAEDSGGCTSDSLAIYITQPGNSITAKSKADAITY